MGMLVPTVWGVSWLLRPLAEESLLWHASGGAGAYVRRYMLFLAISVCG